MSHTDQTDWQAEAHHAWNEAHAAGLHVVACEEVRHGWFCCLAESDGHAYSSAKHAHEAEAIEGALDVWREVQQARGVA
jgi:hypothetical protein